MTYKELCNEAIRKYPIGTKVQTLVCGIREDRIRKIEPIDIISNKNTEVWFEGYTYNLLLYRNGEWAKILSIPITETYSIY